MLTALCDQCVEFDGDVTVLLLFPPDDVIATDVILTALYRQSW